MGYQRKKVKFVWSPKGKNLKFIFNYFQKNRPQLPRSVQYDEFEHVWDELIIFEKKIWKNLKKSENFYLAIFRKKVSIWAYLRWMDNFWKKKSENFFKFLYSYLKFFFHLLSDKKISIALNWKKVSIMMNLSIFEINW